MGTVNEYPGKLIAVSGIDGCGKSELCRRIGEYLIDVGERIWFSSAISDASTTIGGHIGDLLRDPQTECPIPPDAEHALMIAARVLAQKNVIEPALESGRWVVSDRYALCGKVYQRENNHRFMRPSIYNMRLSLFGLTMLPDLEIVLDIDPDNLHKPLDPDNRLEDRPSSEWHEMRSQYRLAARSQPNTYVMDGNQKPAVIFDQVRPYLDELRYDRV